MEISKVSAPVSLASRLSRAPHHHRLPVIPAARECHYTSPLSIRVTVRRDARESRGASRRKLARKSMLRSFSAGRCPRDESRRSERADSADRVRATEVDDPLSRPRVIADCKPCQRASTMRQGDRVAAPIRGDTDDSQVFQRPVGRRRDNRPSRRKDGIYRPLG